MLYALYIVNKAGGLIFWQSIEACPNPLASRLNDQLRLASTFHSLHTIAAQLAPTPTDKDKGGIKRLDTRNVTLQCLYTFTGLKFFVTAHPDSGDLSGFLGRVYELYSDFVLKNPFYELDMPIKCRLFDEHLKAVIEARSGR